MAFHNHRPGPTDFGERGEQLLSLILPSLRAALAIQERLGRHRTELLALLDRIEDALVLFDERCYPAHVNRSATAMVAGDPEGDALLRRAAMLARIGRHRPEQRCSVVTAVARYELRAAQVTEQLLGDGRSTVILIDRASPRLPTSDALRRRWKLTAREAEVALLLARGARNAAIASALHISARTARTHTEHVFSKLGVATRAQVGDRLRG